MGQNNEAVANDGVARIVSEREGCRKGEGRGIKPAVGGFGSGIWVAGQVGPLDIVAVHEPDVCHVVGSSQVHGKGSAALGNKNSARAPAAGKRTNPASGPLRKGQLVENVANESVPVVEA